MTQPTAPERLLHRLAVLPDACRAIEAAIDRARIRGGGEIPLRFVVTAEGEIDRIEIAAVYERTETRPLTGAGTL